MANNKKQYVNKNRRKQKENVVPIQDPHNLCSMISDEEAMKIHGLNFENNYSTDSDSGKSSFDEEFFKNKPEPLKITPNNTITIRQLTINNEQPQLKKDNLCNAEIKKDFSSLSAGKSLGKISSNSSSSRKRLQGHLDHNRPLTKNVQAVNTIQPNLNKFSVNENNFHNFSSTTCQIPTISKQPSKDIQDKEQKSTNVERPKVENLNYHHGVLNERAIFPVNFQIESYRNNVVKRPSTTSQTSTETKNQKIIRENKHDSYIVPTISGQVRGNVTNYTPLNRNIQGTTHYSIYQPSILDACALPNSVTKVPNSISNRNTTNPSISRSVTNSLKSQNVQISSNQNLSTQRDLIVGEHRGGLEETGISEETSETAGLCEQINSSFCGRCLDVIFCRKC